MQRAHLVTERSLKILELRRGPAQPQWPFSCGSSLWLDCITPTYLASIFSIHWGFIQVGFLTTAEEGIAGECHGLIAGLQPVVGGSLHRSKGLQIDV